MTLNQIAAIRTCLHHTIRRFEEKSITAVSHCGAVPQIESGGVNVTAEIMEVLAVAEASLTDGQRLRLSDEERQAIERQADWMSMQAQEAGDIHSADLRSQEAATLRGLLERTQ